MTLFRRGCGVNFRYSERVGLKYDSVIGKSGPLWFTYNTDKGNSPPTHTIYKYTHLAFHFHFTKPNTRLIRSPTLKIRNRCKAPGQYPRVKCTEKSEPRPQTWGLIQYSPTCIPNNEKIASPVRISQKGANGLLLMMVTSTKTPNRRQGLSNHSKQWQLTRVKRRAARYVARKTARKTARKAAIGTAAALKEARRRWRRSVHAVAVGKRRVLRITKSLLYGFWCMSWLEKFERTGIGKLVLLRLGVDL